MSIQINYVVRRRVYVLHKLKHSSRIQERYFSTLYIDNREETCMLSFLCILFVNHTL